MAEVIFSLRDVQYSYLGKFPALCGIDMTAERNQRIAIVGANGTGKSTLLQMCDGLVFPSKGSIVAYGKTLSEELLNDEVFSFFFRSRVGFVFQNPEVQLFCPTVEEDICFGPLQLGVALDVVRQRLAALAATFGIEELLARSPHQLSVGEKRKVAIASTLASDPEVLLLDEPTAGLDPATVRQVVDIVNKAHADGKTVVTATHDLHILEEIADTVYCIGKDKRIVRQGPVHELLADQEFLEANNLIHIHAHRHKGEVHAHPHQHLDEHHH